MRLKRPLLYFLLLISLFAAPLCAQDRDTVQYWTLSGGIGYGRPFALFNLRTKGFFSTEKIESPGVFAGAFEKKISTHFGLGFAFSYQSLTVTSRDFRTMINGTPLKIQDYYELRNYAGRALLFLDEQPKLDIYFGARIGYSVWSYQTTSTDEFHIAAAQVKNNVSFQALYGMRYFPGVFGFGFEVGLGTAPYLALAEVCLKFE